MTPKKNYSRFFIILQEEERGYTLDREETPSGYVKLEKNHGKCKVSYYVQNINPKMQPYYMALVCANKDNKKMINLGKLNFDESGKVEVSYDYDSENIGGVSMSMESVTGASILKLVDNNVIGVMAGFNASVPPKSWQNYEILINKEEEKRGQEGNAFDAYEERIEISKSKSRAEKGDAIIVEGENKDIFIDNEVEVEEVKEYTIKSDNRVELQNKNSTMDVKEAEIIEDVIEEKSVYHYEKENIPKHLLLDEDDRATMERAKEDMNHDVSSNYFYEDEASLGATEQYFRGVVEDCDDFSELEDEILNCKWKKVTVRDIEELHNMCNYDKHVVLYYPMACYHSYIVKNGHFIFGMKMDKKKKLKYLVYGIPGSKSKNDQPFGGKTGFVTWIPCKNKEDKGYWIMFYDYKNSTVVIPMKKKDCQ
ncbi:MAG: hypothetical protein RSB70_03895 [Clostridium sp.]